MLNLKVGVSEDVIGVAPAFSGVVGSSLTVRHQEHQGVHQLVMGERHILSCAKIT